MIGRKQGKCLNTFVDDYVVFDLETTGVSRKKDKIIEVSAIKVRNRKVVDTFSTLVNPERHISHWASEVNHIYDDMVEGAPLISEVIPDFIDFIEELPVLGHNIIRFDMPFIYKECRDILNGIPNNDCIDTLPISRAKLPDMEHHGLGDLAKHFGISTEGAHRALKDCEMTQQVYEFMREI